MHCPERKKNRKLPLLTGSRPPVPKRKKHLAVRIHQAIDLDGTTVSYLLCRSSRRTIGFVIDESGLRVTAPKRSAIHTIENALIEKRKWILDKLDYYRNRRQAKPAPLSWQEGAVFPSLGRELTLHLEKSATLRPAFRLEDENSLAIRFFSPENPVSCCRPPEKMAENAGT